MPTVLLCDSCAIALRLPEAPPILIDEEPGALPPEMFAEPNDPRWGWDRRSPFALAPAVAACALMAEHAEHGCRLVPCGDGPILIPEDGRAAEELSLAGQEDAEARRSEPALREVLERPESGAEEDRAHALAAARGWLAEPEERDRRLRLGAAAAFRRLFRASGREDARLLRVLTRGSEERRGAYAGAVAALRSGEAGVLALARACRLSERELGLDHPESEALETDLRSIVAAEDRSRFDRGRAFALLMRVWPTRPTKLRELGVLSGEPPPSWERWSRLRSQQEAARLCAARQDPELLRRLLADEGRLAACQLAREASPREPWAVEAAAQVAGELSVLEPERAADFEPLVRARLLRRPADPKHGPQRLIQAHAALLGAMPREAAEPAASEVLDALIHEGRFEDSGAWTYLPLWTRSWAAAPELGERLRDRCADRTSAPAARIAARAALAELARMARGALSAFEASADEALVRALREPRCSPELGALLRRHLDRWLSLESVAALREEGLLEARSLPPYFELPGASTGNGNKLYPALDELARKVEPEELMVALERVPRCQTSEDLARAVTALNIMPRMARVREGLFDAAWPKLALLFGEERSVAHQRRQWTIDQEAFKAAMELVPQRLKRPIDDPAELLRAALSGALEREEKPETYFSKVGLYGAGALAKLFRSTLAREDKERLAGWLERVMLDRERGAYARLNAYWALEGLSAPRALEEAERRLLARIVEPEESAELREEAHALLAARLPVEVGRAQEAGLLPSLALPAVEELHVPAYGGLVRAEPKVAAFAARQHPGSLVAAIADGDTPLDQLCSALLFAGDALKRGAKPAGWAAALRGRLGDGRSHEARGGRWSVRRLAAEADVAAHKKDSAALLAGLEAALNAEEGRIALFYEPFTSKGEARRAAGPDMPIARLYALELAKGSGFDAAFAWLEDQVKDESIADERRLAALDALSIMVSKAPRAKRSDAEERRASLIATMEAAGLIASGEAIEGLFMAADWPAMRLPGFAWVKR